MSTLFSLGEAGPDRHPYTCSYHAFRLADGRMVAVDVVRSDDTGRLGLRVFLADDDGGVRALIYEAPQADWAPFAVTERPALDGSRPTIGRGDGWVAGRVDGAGPDLAQVAFDLTVEPLDAGFGPGDLGLAFVKMAVRDFTRVHTAGWIELDGERHPVDAVGTVSVHYGRFLCEYTYLLNVAGDASAAPSLLAASARGDDLRFGGELLGPNVVTYAYASGGSALHARSAYLGPFSTTPLALGEGATLELSDMRLVPHRLLDLPVVAGTAHATYVLAPPPGAPPAITTKRIPLGRVLLDARGDAYVNHFTAAGV